MWHAPWPVGTGVLRQVVTRDDPLGLVDNPGDEGVVDPGGGGSCQTFEPTVLTQTYLLDESGRRAALMRHAQAAYLNSSSGF